MDWLQEVWKKRDGAFFDSKSLLVMDSMKAHIKESVTTVAKKKTLEFRRFNKNTATVRHKP